MNLNYLNPQYFAERRFECCIGDVLASALVTAGGSLIGSIFGNKAKQKEVENTNYTNLFINKQQLEEARRAATTAFNRQNYLIDKQNAYNSFENQRLLMQRAGYNPNLMVDGSAGTAVSSGSTNPPQQQIPSALPVQAANLTYAQDFANIMSTIADAKLKESQTSKTKSETVGQDIKNDFDHIQTQLLSKWGDIEREYNLNESDSRRALNDAMRLVQGSVHSLNMDELYNMRPKEASKLVSDTLTSQSQATLNSVVAAKTERERDLLLSRFVLDSKIAASTIAYNYANARSVNLQSSLWSPPSGIVSNAGGLLYRKARSEANTAFYESLKVKSDYKEVYDYWQSALKSQLRAVGLWNDKVSKLVESNAGFGFINLVNNLPFTSGNSFQPIPLSQFGR